MPPYPNFDEYAGKGGRQFISESDIAEPLPDFFLVRVGVGGYLTGDRCQRPSLIITQAHIRL